jgi:hypothetical protein
VPLLTTPLDQVSYEQVIEFCKTFPEGVRVEYKREPGKNTPKIVSSFANTVGGIWVIGVDADKMTNTAQLPPIGIKLEPGIEERITQSAVTGIYPGITPAVRVFRMPDKPDHALVVVKVAESVEAPHAIENSTRVYVRNASTTEPAELADIDRIDYLLKRRRESSALRERLIVRAAERSPFIGIVPRVRTVVCPVYPRGTLLTRDELLTRAQRLHDSHVHQVRDFRLVHEAIAVRRAGTATSSFYFEFSVDGVAFYESPARIRGEWNGTPFVMIPQLLAPLQTLNTILALVQDRVTNLLVRYELHGWQGLAFLPYEPARLDDPYGAVEIFRCSDLSVTVEATVAIEGLIENRTALFAQLLEDVLWAFNYRDPKLPGLVHEAAKAANLA